MTDKIKSIVIDDDPLITDLLQHYCSKIPHMDYCLTFNKPVDGLRMISSQDFDLIFLDYNMPELSGKTFLDLKSDQSKVIMITSNQDFAVDSYNYPQVIDYLLKPISFERFELAIERYDKGIQEETSISTPSSKDKLFLKDGNKWIQVTIADIIYIKSESNYLTFHFKENKVMTLMSLKEIEEKLPNTFIRTHRSYIINRDFIDYITVDDVSVGKQLLPIGASYKAKVKELINQQ